MNFVVTHCGKDYIISADSLEDAIKFTTTVGLGNNVREETEPPVKQQPDNVINISTPHTNT